MDPAQFQQMMQMLHEQQAAQNQNLLAAMQQVQQQAQQQAQQAQQQAQQQLQQAAAAVAVAANVLDGSYVKVRREQLKGSCPLQVVKHPVSGKRRLVQDLRWIYGHLPNVKFRMESLHTELGDVVQPDDVLFTTDIAKAYYCLAMHPDAQQFLGWEWKGEFYMPTCLVFGLAPAPRIFTKIMRLMMAFFRSSGCACWG